MNVTKDNNYTHFRMALPKERIVLSMRRIFHPVRGDEVQIEILIERDGKVRTTTTRASVTMKPADAWEFSRLLVGSFRPPPDAIRTDLPNIYNPPTYDKMDAAMKRAVRLAFDAGRDYERSLLHAADALGAPSLP